MGRLGVEGALPGLGGALLGLLRLQPRPLGLELGLGGARLRFLGRPDRPAVGRRVARKGARGSGGACVEPTIESQIRDTPTVTTPGDGAQPGVQ